MTDNDNEPSARSPQIDPLQAHGRAALTLVESLIHGLIAKSVLTPEESLDIVDTALDVQTAYAAEAGMPEHTKGSSEALLARILASLRTDIGPRAGLTKRDAQPRLVGTVDPSLDASIASAAFPPTDDGVIR